MTDEREVFRVPGGGRLPLWDPDRPQPDLAAPPERGFWEKVYDVGSAPAKAIMGAVAASDRYQQ